MSAAHDYCGILLAAGQSRRFGADKLLHPLADGTPMALASARVLRAALPQLVAVVDGANRALADHFAAAGIPIVVAPQAGTGMGASLAAGVAATAAARGWVVALADKPFLQAASAARVVEALAAGAAIAAPRYRGRRGHPVGFAAPFGNALMALAGDAGARAILEEHAAAVRLLDCDDPGVLRDVDRPADLDAPG